MNDLIQTVAVYALPVLFAITLHEAAHAYAAKYFGDETAYSQGRMSLDPIKHIDLFGTILLPLALYFTFRGTFLIGYAKPVPIDFGKLRNPKRDMAWVALAGPAANFVMVLLWLLFSIALAVMHIDAPFLSAMTVAGIRINLTIFAFNLFPVPPLDGGRIVTSILPRKYAYQFAKIEPYGFIIVLAFVLINNLMFDYWIEPIRNAVISLLNLFFS